MGDKIVPTRIILPLLQSASYHLTFAEKKHARQHKTTTFYGIQSGRPAPQEQDRHVLPDPGKGRQRRPGADHFTQRILCAKGLSRADPDGIHLGEQKWDRVYQPARHLYRGAAPCLETGGPVLIPDGM